MIRIHRPIRPTKRSGHRLEPGEKTTVKGITIVNTAKFAVYIDKYTARKAK